MSYNYGQRGLSPYPELVPQWSTGGFSQPIKRRAKNFYHKIVLQVTVGALGRLFQSEPKVDLNRKPRVDLLKAPE